MNASHQPVFQRRFLRPRYWPIWFAALMSVILAFLPGRLRAGLGDGMGRLLSPLRRRFMTGLSSPIRRPNVAGVS